MIDAVLRWILAPFATRWHRRRLKQPVREEWISDWHRVNPGRCLYCSYTRWANEEMGQTLKIDFHACREGNGDGQADPPRATARYARGEA